jgi:hypothetical protein
MIFSVAAHALMINLERQQGHGGLRSPSHEEPMLKQYLEVKYDHHNLEHLLVTGLFRICLINSDTDITVRVRSRRCRPVSLPVRQRGRRGRNKAVLKLAHERFLS